jgi:hypothetical protein
VAVESCDGRRVKAGIGIFVRIFAVLRQVDEIHMGNPGSKDSIPTAPRAAPVNRGHNGFACAIYGALYCNPLDFIEADLIASAILKLRGARRRAVRHRGDLFKCPAVLEIGGDARCPKAVIAQLGCDAGRARAPADHRIGVRLRQHCG